MALRYAIKSGDWSDSSVWSATSGGSGGAGVPTGYDSVYMQSNYSVTLVADAACYAFNMSNGTLNTNGYKLTSETGFTSYGTTARTINFGSSTKDLP